MDDEKSTAKTHPQAMTDFILTLSVGEAGGVVLDLTPFGLGGGALPYIVFTSAKDVERYLRDRLQINDEVVRETLAEAQSSKRYRRTLNLPESTIDRIADDFNDQISRNR